MNPVRLPLTRGRFFVEFLLFGVKQIRACLFAGLFFLAVFLVPRSGVLDLPRYDVLLLVALLVQVWLVVAKVETLDELKAISLFHVLGFGLEVFKTSNGIGSWSYPDPAYTKVFGVPLFTGFMYAAVGSYLIQAWRLFDLRIRHHPPYPMAFGIALLVYLNFFTYHFIGDYRWYIAACALGLYARSTVIFRPADRETYALVVVISPHRFFLVVGGESEYLFRDLALSESTGRVVGRSSRQVEFLVATGHHDVYNCGEPKAYKGSNSRPRIAFGFSQSFELFARFPKP